MFIGHYAVALAAKRVAPKAHVVPGPNPFLTLWLDSIPISHSLITLIGWGALFAYLYRVRTGDGRAALVVALLVVSHWLLDYVTHRPDMPLYPGGTPWGLGLWNSVTGAVAVGVGGIDIERDGALPGRALPETALSVTAWPESALNASPATPHSVTPFPVTPHSN